MKANITFIDNIFEDKEHRITVYADSKQDIFYVTDSLGRRYVVTNCYIKEDEKKES